MTIVTTEERIMMIDGFEKQRGSFLFPMVFDDNGPHI